MWFVDNDMLSLSEDISVRTSPLLKVSTKNITIASKTVISYYNKTQIILIGLSNSM